MNAKFFDLNKNKQDAILNAILKVFSKNSYLHSSTDEIVKEAIISKGLLFHYFFSKVGAYEFAYDYSLKFIILELNSIINMKEDNYFQLWKHIEDGHLLIMRQYPHMIAFIAQVNREKDSNAKKDIFEKEASLLEVYKTILNKADENRFPKESKIRASACFVLQGIDNEYYNKRDLDIEKLYAKKMEYLSFLQNLFEQI